MTPHATAPYWDDAFGRVIRRRMAAGRARTLEAALIALLAWLASGSALFLPWLAATIASGLAERCLSRAWMRGDHGPAARRLAAAGQALSAATYASAAVLLLAQPSPVRLAQAAFVLCAITLANALKSSGSRLATVALVAPPATLLFLSPFWAAVAGSLELSDMALLAVGGLAYVVFIVRLSASRHAEDEAMHRAKLEADAGHQRWRMIFDHSPTPRVCFNASALYELLRPRLARGERPGDAIRAEFASWAVLDSHIIPLDRNEAAALQGRDTKGAHFTDAFLEPLCEALNSMDEDGFLPPIESELVLPDGTALIVQARLRLTSGLGAPWSLCLGEYLDLTDMRRAQRTQDQARKAAEDANRAKSDFLTVVSHEIRTPLNGVLGMAQAMAAEAMAAEQRERLHVILDSGSALMRLVDDLLDLSQLETGRLTLDARDFDLAAEVEAAHRAFGGCAAAKGLDYALEIDPAARGLWTGDPNRMRQIAAHLISNAVKFTPQGKVSARLSRSASGVRLEVADTGVGIAPERVGRIFETFAQADVSATRAHGGLGLGLAVCHELCRAMGGAISVESRPGEGSTFALELPLRPADATELVDPRAVLPTVPTGAAVRVLAAEDNPVNRMVLQTLLAQIGLDPTIVEDGAEAVRAWEAAHWDLILMDVRMPVMDGTTATMTIRAREALSGRPRTPIVAVTANTMAHQVASYRAAGMDDVVRKPLGVGELVSAIARALNKGEDDNDSHPAFERRAAV